MPAFASPKRDAKRQFLPPAPQLLCFSRVQNFAPDYSFAKRAFTRVM